jgi:hypothetical protein
MTGGTVALGLLAMAWSFAATATPPAVKIAVPSPVVIAPRPAPFGVFPTSPGSDAPIIIRDGNGTIIHDRMIEEGIRRHLREDPRTSPVRP